MGSFKLYDPGLHTIISAAFTSRKSTVDAWSIEYMLTQTSKWKLLWNRRRLEAGLKWADKRQTKALRNCESTHRKIIFTWRGVSVLYVCFDVCVAALQRHGRLWSLGENESLIFFFVIHCVGPHPKWNKCTSNNIEAEVFTWPPNYTHILTHCLRWSDSNHHNCGHTSLYVKYGIFVAWFLLLLHAFFNRTSLRQCACKCKWPDSSCWRVNQNFHFLLSPVLSHYSHFFPHESLKIKQRQFPEKCWTAFLFSIFPFYITLLLNRQQHCNDYSWV